MQIVKPVWYNFKTNSVEKQERHFVKLASLLKTASESSLRKYFSDHQLCSHLVLHISTDSVDVD